MGIPFDGGGRRDEPTKLTTEEILRQPDSGRYRVSYEKNGKRLIFTHAHTWESARLAVQRLRGMEGVTCPRIRILGEPK